MFLSDANHDERNGMVCLETLIMVLQQPMNMFIKSS